MPRKNDMENIFHMYMDQNSTWINFLDDNFKLMNNLDETFNKLKCTDGTHSKTIMKNENHISMDESYKKDEIFGWMWSMNELLDDNWNQTNCLNKVFGKLSVWMKKIPK